MTTGVPECDTNDPLFDQGPLLRELEKMNDAPKNDDVVNMDLNDIQTLCDKGSETIRFSMKF